MALQLNIGEAIGDVARSNLFEVEIPYLGQDFSFVCKTANLPASTVEPLNLSYQNRKIVLAGDRTFEPWTVSVYNDEKHTVRTALLEWSDLVVEHGRNIYGTKPEEYKRDGYVRQFGRDGEQTVQYMIKGLFPTSIAEVTLDWDENSTAQIFTVTFSVDWWEIS